MRLPGQVAWQSPSDGTIQLASPKHLAKMRILCILHGDIGDEWYEHCRSTGDEVRNFPQMKEDVREHGVIAVCSHKRMVGAFISPAVMEELELLRRRKRELTRIEDADEGFFEALDDAVATYEDPV